MRSNEAVDSLRFRTMRFLLIQKLFAIVYKVGALCSPIQ
jgi:hypothetical protein